MSEALRVGLVGAGWAAGEHASSLGTFGDVSIAGVTDLDGARAAALAARTGAPVFGSWRELLDDASPDALVVATPPGARVEPAVAALEAGIAVFLEKPIARTLDDAYVIVRAQGRSGSVCAVGYQWRAAAAVDVLRTALDGAEVALLISAGVGITQARAWFGDPRQSGGIVSERGSHHIDLQRAIGGDVARVRAVRGSVPLSGVAPAADTPREDVVSLTLEFVSGAVGAIHVAWTPEDHPSFHRLSVVSTDGAYELELDPRFTLRGVRGGVPVEATSPEPPFVAGLARFCRAARAREPRDVACSARDAAGSLATAIACEQALASGETVAVAHPSPQSRPKESH
jgi:myo-inositol 2-dehydrogenase / D-chiro-inositol 1-dehydrogenase